MNKPLNILIVNNYAGRGGIPKACAELANAMAKRQHKVTVICQKPVPKLLHSLYRFGHKLNELSLGPGRRPPLPLGTDKFEDIYPLHKGVSILPYSFSDKNQNIQALRARLRALKADVCVCPLPDGAQMVWAATLCGSGIPYVYSERTSPEAVENIFWCRRGRLAAMSGADSIHLLSPAYLDSLPAFLRERAFVIPNAVKIPAKLADTNARPGNRKRLLWLGRLFEEAKQCRLAIEAFIAASATFPDWEMRIVGDGPDRVMLEKYARQFRAGDRLIFAGESGDPKTEFLQSQAFCFSSRHEGMPNALLEALACGLPCAAFAACPGVSDLVRDGETGLLALEMTSQALAEKLAQLFASAELRQKLGQAAPRSLDAYSHEKVFSAWEQLLFSAAAKKGATVMDGFREEPFASRARMAHKSMQEWAIRDFGQPFPGGFEAKLWKAPGRVYKAGLRLGSLCKMDRLF